MSSKSMNQCSVDGCTNSSRDQPHLNFFRIPKEIERMKIWVELIGREDILDDDEPYKYKVCSLHFDPIMITNCNHLVSNAVPSRNLPFDSVQGITELAQSGDALIMPEDNLIMDDQMEQPMVIIDGQTMMPTQPMVLQSQPMMQNQTMLVHEEIMDSQPIFIDMGPTHEQYMTEQYHSENHVKKPQILENRVISASYMEDLKVDLGRQPVAGTSAQKPLKMNVFTKLKGRRVKCPECNYYTANNEDQMVRHIKKMHRGENPFQCFMCDYSTYNKTIFEEHVRVHQGLKPYKCSVCPHRSVAKKNLKKHEMIHRPDNPLKCPKCDFIARHQRALNYHVAKCKLEVKKEEVTRESPKRKKSKVEKIFNCKHCGWASSNKPKILLHLIHHPKQKVDSRIDLSILRKYGIVD